MIIVMLLLIFVFIPTQTSVAADQLPNEYVSAARKLYNHNVSVVHTELIEKLDGATPEETIKIAEAIVEESLIAGIDPLFILAIIESESNFHIEAVSPSGARGLMQLVPSTFKAFNTSKRMFDPIENVKAGIRYIRHLRLNGFGKNGPDNLLLAYNQGPGGALSIIRDGNEMSDEAQAYAPKVMNKYRDYLKRHGRKPQDAKKLFLVRTK